MKQRWSRQAFTLVEALTATALLGIVSVVLCAVLFNGIALWQTMLRQPPRFALALAWEQLRLDLANAVEYGDMVFQGDESAIRFVTVAPPQDANAAHAVLSVEYWFDSQTGSLRRRRGSAATASRQQPAARSLVESVTDIAFRYAWFDDESQTVRWLRRWPPDELPEFVGAMPAYVRADIQWRENAGTVHEQRTALIAGGR